MNNEQRIALKALKDVLATYKHFADNGQPLELEKQDIEWLQDNVYTLEEALNNYDEIYQTVKNQIENYYTDNLDIDDDVPSEEQIFDAIHDHDKLIEATDEITRHALASLLTKR